MKINDEKNTNLKSMFMTRIRLICSVTDVDGKYEITIPREYVTSLVFSYIGMKVREVVIEHKIVINVKLEEDTKKMEEVIVTGIFKKQRESYTGSVTTISNKVLKMFRGQNLLANLNNIDPTLILFRIMPPGVIPMYCRKSILGEILHFPCL